MILKLLLISFILLLPIASAMDSYNVRYNITDINATPTPTPQIIISSGGGFGSSTVSQNPPEVFINLIDTTIPNIEVSINIKNEGLYAYEYTYSWELYKYNGDVPIKINNGKSSKYLTPGESSTIPLTFDITEGTYELTVDVFWSTYKSSSTIKFEVLSILSGSQKRVTKFINNNIIIVLIVLTGIFSASLYFGKIKK